MIKHLLVALMALALSTQAHAFDFTNPLAITMHTPKAAKQIHYRPAKHRHKRAPAVMAYEERHLDDGRRCLSNSMVVWSTPHQTEARAIDAAKVMFRAAVQNEHGSKYMDPDVAADFRTRCNIADPRDSVSGDLAQGAAQILGNSGELYRCVLKARPCTKPMDDGK